MAGPRGFARWVGSQNMIGNVPGVIGLIDWVFILGRVESVDWDNSAKA